MENKKQEKSVMATIMVVASAVLLISLVGFIGSVILLIWEEDPDIKKILQKALLTSFVFICISLPIGSISSRLVK